MNPPFLLESEFLYVLRLKPFVTLHYVERDAIPLVELCARDDSGLVDEIVLAVVSGYEAEPLAYVIKFYLSFCHLNYPDMHWHRNILNAY